MYKFKARSFFAANQRFELPKISDRFFLCKRAISIFLTSKSKKWNTSQYFTYVFKKNIEKWYIHICIRALGRKPTSFEPGLSELVKRYRFTLKTTLRYFQSDQIGRIIAQRVIDYFG
jgi:hypothetical protein